MAVPAAAASNPPPTLSVVLADNFGPHALNVEDGAPRGHLRELWELWGRRNGVTVTFEFMEWQQGIEQVKSGRADVLGTLPSGPAVAGLRSSLHELAAISYHAFSRHDVGAIRKAGDLADIEVGVVDNCGCAGWLKAMGHRKLRSYPSFHAMTAAAERGEVRVFCSTRSHAIQDLRERDLDLDFRMSPSLYNGSIHWATRSDNPGLHQFIVNGFARISADERGQIARKWQGVADRDETKDLILHVLTNFLLAAVAGVLAFATYGCMLRRRVYLRSDELKATEIRFTALLDCLPELAWIKDLDGRYLAANASLARLCGVADAKAMIGRTCLDFFPREVAEVYRRNDSLVVQSQSAIMVVEPYVRPDGSTHWIESSKAPFLDEAGRCVGVVGISREVLSPEHARTALGQATDALRASEGRFRTLVAALPAGVLEVDRDGTIVFANDQAWSILGLSAERGYEEPWVNLVHAADVPALVVALRNMQAKGDLLNMDVRLASGRRPQVWVHVRGVRCMDTEGATISILDISDRRQLEDRLMAREPDRESLPERLSHVLGADKLDATTSLRRALVSASLYEGIRAAAAD